MPENIDTRPRGREQQPKRIGWWIEPDEYHQATPYHDGDINLETTVEQTESLIEKLQNRLEQNRQ